MIQKIENNIIWISLAIVAIVGLICLIRGDKEPIIPVKATYTPQDELIGYQAMMMEKKASTND